MNKTYDPKTIKFARDLRKNSTDQERKLWGFLRGSKFYGFKFRRQFPVGKYFADFACVKAKLIIELDGGQHSDPLNREYDKLRDEFFATQGYRILRIWNNELGNNLEGVGEKIYQLLMDPHP